MGSHPRCRFFLFPSPHVWSWSLSHTDSRHTRRAPKNDHFWCHIPFHYESWRSTSDRPSHPPLVFWRWLKIRVSSAEMAPKHYRFEKYQWAASLKPVFPILILSGLRASRTELDMHVHSIQKEWQYAQSMAALTGDGGAIALGIWHHQFVFKTATPNPLCPDQNQRPPPEGRHLCNLFIYLQLVAVKLWIPME